MFAQLVSITATIAAIVTLIGGFVALQCSKKYWGNNATYAEKVAANRKYRKAVDQAVCLLLITVLLGIAALTCDFFYGPTTWVTPYLYSYFGWAAAVALSGAGFVWQWFNTDLAIHARNSAEQYMNEVRRNRYSGQQPWGGNLP